MPTRKVSPTKPDASDEYGTMPADATLVEVEVPMPPPPVAQVTTPAPNSQPQGEFEVPLSPRDAAEMELLDLIGDAIVYARAHKPKQAGERGRVFQLIITDLEKVFAFGYTWLAGGVDLKDHTTNGDAQATEQSESAATPKG